MRVFPLCGQIFPFCVAFRGYAQDMYLMRKRRMDFALSAGERIEAREALALLEGSGLSLTAAAKIALAGKRALRRCTLGEAADMFLRSRLLECRSSTAGWYEGVLSIFVREFGGRQMDSITRAELRGFIDGQEDLAPSTRAGLARGVRTFWRWGLAQEPPVCGSDVTVGLKTSAGRPAGMGVVECLSVEEVAAVLAGAGRYRNALALLLFAGVRPGEVAAMHKPPLLWGHVNVTEKLIRIPGAIAKTGKPRIIEGLPETLWRWLVPGRPGERVCPGRTVEAQRCAKRVLGRWPHDATRHTFATYALALTSDPGKVSLWLGHEGNPQMLYRHYRGLKTKAEAEAFWALRDGSGR
jgi:integrase